MDKVLLIFVGLASGLALIAFINVVAILWARHDARTGRSLLADASRTSDAGPSITGASADSGTSFSNHDPGQGGF